MSDLPKDTDLERAFIIEIKEPGFKSQKFLVQEFTYGYGTKYTHNFVMKLSDGTIAEPINVIESIIIHTITLEQYADLLHLIQTPDCLIKTGTQYAMNASQMHQKEEKKPSKEALEKQAIEEMGIITEYLTLDDVGPMSSGENATYRYLRNVFFEKEFALQIKNQKPQNWNRLLNAAMRNKKAAGD